MQIVLLHNNQAKWNLNYKATLDLMYIFNVGLALPSVCYQMWSESSASYFLCRLVHRDIFMVWLWQYYFHHRNAMSVNQLISEAYHLLDSTPADVHPQNALDDFCPLTKGQYPIFNKYPKFIVDYQVTAHKLFSIYDIIFFIRKQSWCFLLD
jgi:hypothetical protein